MATEDLDLFLAGVEAKLRGPFTPLDLTKVMVTPALRGTSVSIATYVEQLSKVFHRTEKVIQMRIVLALAALVLRDEVANDEQVQTTILSILKTAQQSSAQEEWVKTIAGLVEGILFSTEEEQRFSQEMMQNACREIIESVQELEQTSAAEEERERAQQEELEDQDDADEAAAFLRTRLHTADIDPTLAPYSYCLLKPQILEQVIPEATEQHHFTVNENADLLHLDRKLEARKAEEEAEHDVSAAANIKGNSGSGGATNGKKVVTPGPIMPGMQRSTINKTTGMSAAAKAKLAAKRQSNMFLNRKPTQASAAARGGGGLHVRKAGASQRLVGKGRQVKPGLSSATAGTSSLVGGGGRAAKLRDAKASKMKVLDASEVQGLAREGGASGNSTILGPKKGIKRKADQAAAAAAASKMAKQAAAKAANGRASASAASSKMTAPAPAPASPSPPATQEAAPAPAAPAFAAGGLVAAALSNYQRHVAATTDNKPAAAAPPAVAVPAPAPQQQKQQQKQHHGQGHHQQLDWKQLLQQRANKLSDDDRRRIQMFFEERRNPTPSAGDPKYRVKLHEERTTDPNTGEPIKETYYLNLDYSTWTSNQSKKRKRYSD